MRNPPDHPGKYASKMCFHCGDMFRGRAGDEIHICEDCSTPPVCVCPHPDPDVIGECAKCLRPFKAALMEVRERWLRRLRTLGV